MPSSILAQQVGELSNVRCDASRLILREQLRRRLSSWLFLEINIRKLLVVGVLHDEGRANIFD
jgi:hypothetical protein